MIEILRKEKIKKSHKIINFCKEYRNSENNIKKKKSKKMTQSFLKLKKKKLKKMIK